MTELMEHLAWKTNATEGDCEGIINMTYPYYGWLCPDDEGIVLSFVGVHENVRGFGLFKKLIDRLKGDYRVIKGYTPSALMKNILEKYDFHQEDIELWVWRLKNDY